MPDYIKLQISNEAGRVKQVGDAGDGRVAVCGVCREAAHVIEGGKLGVQASRLCPLHQLLAQAVGRDGDVHAGAGR